MHLINPFWGGGGGGALPCAWNPDDAFLSPTFSDNNNRVVSNANISGVRGTLAHSTGKWYFEVLASVTVPGSNSPGIGLITGAATLDGTWVDGNRWYIQSSPAFVFGPSENKSSGVTYVNGDVYSIAVDFDAGRVWFGKNGAWILAGNPATGANPAWADVVGTLYPWARMAAGVDITGRFHAADMQFSIPSGFSAWCP